jgi:hypothetical protein
MILRINRYQLFFFVLIFLASCTKETKISSDQAGQFVKFFGGSAIDKAESVLECSDGGFALTGTMSVGSTKSKAFLIRTDQFGNELSWSPVLLGDSIQNSGYSIISANNGFLVVGSSVVFSNNTTNSDVFVAKIGNDGSVTWQKKFGGNLNDEALCAIQTKSGSFLIGGYTESKGKGGKDAWAIMLDSDGNLLWDQTQGGSKDDCYKSIIETGNNYILVGSTESWLSPGFDRSVFFVKIDKSSATGDPVDFAFYGGLDADSKIRTIVDEGNNLTLMRTFINPTSNLSNILILKVKDDFHQVVWEKNISSGDETGSELLSHNNQITTLGYSKTGLISNLLIKVNNLDGEIISSSVQQGTANQIVTDGLYSSDNHLVFVGSNSIDNYSKISLRKMK